VEKIIQMVVLFSKSKSLAIKCKVDDPNKK